MTVHLISVGLGITDFKHHGRWRPRPPQVAPHEALTHQMNEDDKAAADALLTKWFGTDEPARAELRDIVDRAEPALWPASISAELETFAFPPGSRTLRRDDIAVLLASDTVMGLTAALWNAVALVDGNPDRVRYASDPRQLADPNQPGPGPRGTATIVRVPGLCAQNTSGMHTAMGGLGTLGRALRPPATAVGEDLRFYLSGGFKATIPYLIGLAEGLRSLPEFKGEVTAYLLFEKRGGLIPLPLRRINATWVRDELGTNQFDAAGTRTARPTEEDLLLGYAYDGPPGGPWHLTPFGRGLRELFGLTPASLLGS
jgi:hypothetical protein